MAHGEELYSPDEVQRLFDGMAATYGIVNLVSSFGFCMRWRHQCLSLAPVEQGMTVFDLMSGMGELWPGIAVRLCSQGSITGVDFCPAMCKKAEEVRRRLDSTMIYQLEENMLANSIPDGTADCVVSSFGLKTFSPTQRATVASELARILRPGGLFSLLEISVPPSTALRIPYMFYLKYCIPVIGALLLGNPHNYRMLGVYTERFENCEHMSELLRAQGLEVKLQSFFFGCATAVCGRRPG